MRSRLLRAVGAVTAAYGFAVAARPGLLARPSGLAADGGRTPDGTAVVVRPLALRSDRRWSRGVVAIIGTKDVAG